MPVEMRSRGRAHKRKKSNHPQMVDNPTSKLQYKRMITMLQMAVQLDLLSFVVCDEEMKIFLEAKIYGKCFHMRGCSLSAKRHHIHSFHFNADAFKRW